ncbi:hypothetical protein [Cellulomonas sp. S1-8]|uniref:hypothetical protein n=1 Tax=Cellulomonas sp. S1-8 TaxID=2904790 RepID=UPI002244BEA3|nr:hypothetical protein [Cellulomonas sp. S1-8]UZN02988.1 hypothetical protein OKX07_18350 [Cellulomonas sp. S1-8]
MSSGKTRCTVGGAAAAVVLAASVLVGAAPAQGATTGESWYGTTDAGIEYALTPQTAPDAWADAAPADLVAALDVPDADVAGMTTAALLEAALDYPYVGDYVAYSTPQQGLDALRAKSPVIDELIRRPDVLDVVLATYGSADLAAVAATDAISTLHVGFVELVLAQPEVLGQGDVERRADAVGVVVEKWRQKQRIAGGTHYDTSGSALVALRALAQDDPAALDRLSGESAGVATFLEGGLVSALAPSQWKDLLQGLDGDLQRTYRLEAGSTSRLPTVGGGVTPDAPSYTNSSVKTPNGSTVATLTVSGDLTSSQITQINNQMASSYPRATRVRSATAKYNCHSYAWYSQSTSNNRWMNYTAKYWTDGSYRFSSSQSYATATNALSPLVIGHRVSYVNGDHSAYKSGATTLTSKWGQAGLYTHGPNHTPYTSTTTLNYYLR